MSSGIDKEMVREHYQRLPDKDLIHALTNDATGLTPEAQEIVKEEVKRRKLDSNLIKGIEAQQKDYTIEEIDKYCAIIQKLPCPKTGSISERLNATLTAEVMSFVLFTNYRKKIVVGSPDILDKANNDALAKSALLGWWGFPWGIIRTIEAITINTKNKKTNRLDTPNDYLRSFVSTHIGYIETYKDDEQKLLALISQN
jgi:hypothetical protein